MRPSPTNRRFKPGRAVVVGAVLAVALGGGCQSTGSGADRSLADSQWTARSINGQPVAEAVPSTLEFEGTSRVVGSAGCNRYRGDATIDGAAISFGPLATTRRACPPPQMEQERRFTQALRGTTRWEMDGEDLLLFDESGDVRVRLQPLPPSPPARLP